MILRAVSGIVANISSSDIGKRMASGAFWSFAGTVSAKVFVLVAGILCARILGKAAYGELGIVRSTVSLFVTLGSAGMGMTASKFISENLCSKREEIPYIYTLTNGVALIMGVITSILIIVFAKPLAVNVLNAPDVAFELRVGGLMLFVTILNGAQNGVLSGFEDFKSIAVNTFISSIIECILLVAGAYYYGVAGAVLGYGVSFLILWICNYAAIRRNFVKFSIPYVFCFKRELMDIVTGFSVPSALSALLVAPVLWMTKAMLTNMYGFEEVGIYEVADQWKMIILFIPSAISQIVLPILSSISGNRQAEHKSYWKVLNLNILINASIAFTLTVIVFVSGSRIVGLYGSDFTNPWPLVILCASTIFTSISQVVGLAVASLDRMWSGLGFNVLWACMILGFSFLFLKIGMGAAGLASSVFMAYLIHTIIQLAYLRTVRSKMH